MGKRILVIGTGGCGGKLLDSFCESRDNYYEELTNIYDTVFINSNPREMEERKHYKASKNSLLIAGGGTSRDTETAASNIKDDKTSFSNFFINRTNNIDAVIIFTSADGGFGGGTTPYISRFIREMTDVPVNLVAAMPVKTAKRKSIENACLFHSRISELYKDNEINSIVYINNNKMKNPDLFNKKVTDIILKSYELHGGQVDESDMLSVNITPGYKISLDLNGDYRKLSKSINEALKDSPFILPSEFKLDGNNDYLLPVKCSNLGATLDKECYDIQLLTEFIEPSVLDKIDYGFNNFIVAGGFALPNDYAAEMLELLKTLKDNELEDEKNKKSDLFQFNIEPKKTKTKNTKINRNDKIKNFWLD